MNLSEDNFNHGLSLVFLPFLEGDGAQGRSESSKLIQTLTLNNETEQDKGRTNKEIRPCERHLYISLNL